MLTPRRFFRTPKGLLLLVLAFLTMLAAMGAELRLVAPEIGSAAAAAMLIDGVILRVRKGRWVFPDGALLTALIVASILSPYQEWYIAPVTAGIAVLSKYLFRLDRANVFNPAAFALVVTFYLFGSAQSWWGALPDISPLALAALIGTGVFIADRVNKIPLVLAFLASYYLLVTTTAFVGDPGAVAELYRSPDLHAALYFAFFMTTDPPTSPPKNRDQLIYGAIVGVISYAVFELIGAEYFLLAGLLVANVWEAWRRARWRTKRRRRAVLVSA